MADRIDGAVHRVVPAAGHACCLEDPTTFDGYVKEFLEQHGYL
jgi:pimeloyl-ACP methyl ester carboxylesterase